MTNQNLPIRRPTTDVSSRAGLPILVTGNALKKISDPATAAVCQRAIERAIKFSCEPNLTEPRTAMIQNCPLTVHADPARHAVIILSKFPGWPAVTDDLVEELLPFCSPISFA